MATLSQLCQTGSLIRIDEPDELMVPKRLLYGSPNLVAWLDKNLPTMKTQWQSVWTPEQQVSILLIQYFYGRPLETPRQYRHLRPHDKWIWELKTDDIRIFGWFYKMDVFIGVVAGDATVIKDNGFAAAMIEETKHFRQNLNLNPPKHIEGGPADVLSA